MIPPKQKENFDAHQEECVLSCRIHTGRHRWAMEGLNIQQLLEGTKRFNQLQRELGGITHRTLTKQLREMEERGLVNRKDYKEIPPRVEYRLSPLGQSLESVLLAMHEWGECYGRKVSQKK